MTITNTTSSSGNNSDNSKFIPPKLKRSHFLYFNEITQLSSEYTSSSSNSEDLQHFSKLFPVDMKTTPDEEQDVPSLISSSDSDQIPSKVGKKIGTLQFVDESVEKASKVSIPMLSLNNISEQDRVVHHQSNENLSANFLNIESYLKRPYVKSSKEKSFNDKFIHLLIKEMRATKFLEIDKEQVEKLTYGLLSRNVDQFCQHIGQCKLAKANAIQLEQITVALTKKSIAQLNQQNLIIDHASNNFKTFKLMISYVLQKTKIYRSKWIDSLIDYLELLLTGTTLVNQCTKSQKEKKQTAELNEEILKHTIVDSQIRYLLLKLIHPKYKIVLSAVEEQSFWGSDSSYRFIKEIIENELGLRLKIITAQSQCVTFNDVTDEFQAKIDSVDIKQISRSFLMGPKVNYKAILVNGKALHKKSYSGNIQECQQQFFFEFFKELYLSGLSENPSDEFVKQQVQNLIDKNPFVGLDVVYFGSISSWATCHSKLMESFPALFAKPFKTRLQQGTSCQINIEEKERYSIKTIKNYITFPQIKTPGFERSWSSDMSRPLCSIQVTWLVEFDKNDGWKHSISLSEINQKEANDNEWCHLINIFLSPKTSDPNSSIYPPLSESFKIAIDQ